MKIVVTIPERHFRRALATPGAFSPARRLMWRRKLKLILARNRKTDYARGFTAPVRGFKGRKP